MTQEHTPGPWVQTCESVDPDWHIVTTQGGAIIANVFAPQSANARLIAAAPDMLEALQSLAVLFQNDGKARRKAIAAIAKARGQQ